MDMKVWFIIGLLVVSYYQYSNPEKANGLLNPIWGNVKEFLGKNSPIGNKQNSSGVTCPDTNDLVCGTNGVTYKNSCEAALAGMLEVTPGNC